MFDRVEFLESYRSGQYSPFLMQTVLTSAFQYAPDQLVAASGFSSRYEAQDVCQSRATLLYDLGDEISQLRILQGSLVLGTSIHSYTPDKDYRYWLMNAARIAVKMGLHRK